MSIQEVWNIELFSIGTRTIHLSNIVLAITILLIAKLLVWAISSLFNKKLKALHSVDQGRRFAINTIVKYIVYSVAFMLALEAGGIKVTVLIAGSTALFVGLGFGLQNTFNDFISGIILLFEGSLELGDIVEVDKVIGKVTSIRLRTSAITTRDNVTIIVPNHKFVSENVTNWSHENEMTRFRLSVGVAYGSDVPLVAKLLREVAESHEDVEKSNQPIVFFQNFGDSALEFHLLFWTKKSFYSEMILSDLRFKVDAAFRENRVSIPFPQRDLHIRSGLPNPGLVSIPTSGNP